MAGLCVVVSASTWDSSHGLRPAHGPQPPCATGNIGKVNSIDRRNTIQHRRRYGCALVEDVME